MAAKDAILCAVAADTRLEHPAYYAHLEAAQKGEPDVTDWLACFLGCPGRALAATEHTLVQVLAQARFWERHARTTFKSRQRQLLD